MILAVAISLGFTTQAQGYDGLIAPPKSQEKTGSGTTPKEKPQTGYQGLIAEPGAQSGSGTALDALVSKSPALPGAPAYQPARNSEQLQDQARFNSYRFDPLKHLDAETREKITVMRTDALKNYKPARRINGMLAKENSVKVTIDSVMKRVNNPELTPEQRAGFGKQGYEQLLMLSDGLLSSSTISDDVYKSMGLPDGYVKEQREANKNSLARVREALSALKPYQNGKAP